MAGNDYRRDRKQLNVVVPLALFGRVRAAAAVAGVSLQEFVVGALREKLAASAYGPVVFEGDSSLPVQVVKSPVVDRLGELGDWDRLGESA